MLSDLRLMLPGQFRFSHPSYFWGFLALACAAMLIGHGLMHGQLYDPVQGRTLNPLTFYVSEYAGKSPEGWWIKGGILCFCVALAWFCRTVLHHYAQGRWVFWSTLFWLGVTAVMITGLLLVVVFDLLPPRYESAGRSRLLQYVLGPPQPHYVGLTPEQWSMRWYHNLGFRLFINGFLAAALMFLLLDFKRQDWRAAARGVVLMAGVWFFGWWLWGGTPVRGVPQRAVLLLITIWLVGAVRTLQRLPLVDQRLELT